MARYESARHNDLIAGAPFAFVNDVVPQKNTIRPPIQPAYGIQHISPEAPKVHFKGTPPFVPPNAGPPPMLAIAALHEPRMVPHTFVGQTPPFVLPPPRNNAYWAFAETQYDPSGPSYRAWSWARSSVQQQIIALPSRGTGVFTGMDQRFNQDSPYTFLRPTFTVPSPATVGVPAFKASFVKAGGWWDVLSDAPHFFAAGFGLQPPGPPVGRTLTYQLPDSSAAFSFAGNWSAIPSSVVPQPPFGDFALGERQEPATASYTFAGTLHPVANPKPPPGGMVVTRALEADTAPYSYTFSKYIATPFPPWGGMATGSTSLGDQQPWDGPAYSFARFTAPSPGLIPPFGDFALGERQEPATAPFTWGRTVFKPTQTKPLPGVFAPALPADTAAYAFTRNRAIIVVQAIPPVRTRDAFAEYQPNSDAPYFQAIAGVGYSTVFVPANPPPVGFPISEVQTTVELFRSPFTFTSFNQGISEVIPSGLLLLQQAIFDLVNLGFGVFVTYSYSATIPYGYVISENPAQGTPLPPFSVVTIETSVGQPPAPGVIGTLVPDLQGMTAYDARQAIFTAGLSLGQNTPGVISAQTAGTVVAQSPIALSPVPYGTIVQLTLSLGPTKPTVIIPTPT